MYIYNLALCIEFCIVGKEDRSYESEEEESLPQTPIGNEDEAVNQMTFDQVLELRPRSSMAPVSTLMKTNTASPYLFHVSKIGQRPTEREIESRNSSSTLKTTGLQGISVIPWHFSCELTLYVRTSLNLTKVRPLFTLLYAIA